MTEAMARLGVPVNTRIDGHTVVAGRYLDQLLPHLAGRCARPITRA